MIIITLPKDQTLPDSQFFKKITQASIRGDFLEYNSDYSEAKLELSTDVFFTEQDAINIVNAGGEVEGYSFWLEISKSRYESESINSELFKVLYPNSEVPQVLPTWKQLFKFNRFESEDSDKIEFLTSFESEFLKSSIVIKYIIPLVKD